MGSRFRGNDTSEFERHRPFHASRVARSVVEQLSWWCEQWPAWRADGATGRRQPAVRVGAAVRV